MHEFVVSQSWNETPWMVKVLMEILINGTDIIGPNNAFVSQSGLFPARFTDFSPEASNDLKARGEIILNKAFEEIDTERTPENSWLWRMLGSLGSHDLSAMREALGMPTGVHGAALVQPFWK